MVQLIFFGAVHFFGAAWLNNCVGHRNHRHFFLYMAFMVLGTAFIMAFGFQVAFIEFWPRGFADFAFQLRSLTGDFSDLSDLGGRPGDFNGTHFIPLVSE